MEFLVPEQLAGIGWSTIVDELWAYWAGGGFVMPPLVAATVVLWFALGWRFVVLRRGESESLRRLVERAASGELEGDDGVMTRAVRRGVALAKGPTDDLRPMLDDAFAGFDEELSRLSTLVDGIVAAAPLAGLLGTVTGMIETFESLGDMALFAQSGGVAGGISAALISTQMGLAVAIPGMFVGRLLERREERLRSELDELEQLLVAEREAVREGGAGLADDDSGD
jgi:biopolymer transport protein ExbB